MLSEKDFFDKVEELYPKIQFIEKELKEVLELFDKLFEPIDIGSTPNDSAPPGFIGGNRLYFSIHVLESIINILGILAIAEEHNLNIDNLKPIKEK